MRDIFDGSQPLPIAIPCAGETKPPSLAAGYVLCRAIV
jgi:hypothetical protein